MKYRYAVWASLVLVVISLIGCQSKSIVSGVVVPTTNITIPRNLMANMVFFDAETQETKQVSVRVSQSGRFTARVSGDELYLVTISIPGGDLALRAYFDRIRNMSIRFSGGESWV